MKKTNLFIITAAVIIPASIICASCSKSDIALGGTASISMETTGNPSDNSVEILLMPSDNTASYRYAIGSDNDTSEFRTGAMPDIVTVDGNEWKTVTFTGLEQGRTYTVFAAATDNSGKEGAIASIKASTSGSGMPVSTQYLLDRSAGFILETTSDYWQIRYYLGKEEDRQGFEEGSIEGTVLKEITSYAINCFGLEPETAYVLYVELTDRTGYTGDIYSIPFTTLSESSSPGAALTYTNDFYMGSYTATPDAECGKLTVLACEKGTYDEMISSPMHWKGNILEMLKSWESIPGTVSTASGGKPATMEATTPSYALEAAVDIYVLLYDKDKKVAGVAYYQATTPSYDPNASPAEMQIRVSNPGPYGADYTFTNTRNTIGFLYETLDADWFDDFRANDPSYHEYYIHEYLLNNYGYFGYFRNDNNITYTEMSGYPGSRYYACACPMNVNGTQGWGEIVLEEYTTTAE